MEILDDISQLIFQGGDERLDILETGKNKYHVNPIKHRGLFNRGSCTCSTLNHQTEKIFEDLELYDNNQSVLEIRKKQEQRIKKLLNYEGKDEFSLVFAPSGSDLAYLPILFTKILHPKKDILLILTCPEELGSGSQMAYLGKYYANKNQFGEKLEKGDEVNVRYDVNLARFKARNDKGQIIKHSDEISEILEKDKSKAKIGALVIGSKSGIEDDISLIPKLDKDVMWVVDLCQFRNSKRLVNHLLGMGCMVMITGSKFYMAPPFCGVMLVPKTLSKKINESEINNKDIEGFDKIFSYYDFSDDFSNLRKNLKKEINKGLTLRWEIALNEMERFNNIPRGNSLQIINEWNNVVRQAIEKSVSFELMPHQEKTNQSIISFRVKSRFGTYLGYDDLKEFYQVMVSDEYQIGEFNKIFFGQPVKYSCGAFIRVAIGANNIYNLLQLEKEERFNNDKLFMGILDEKARTFI